MKLSLSRSLVQYIRGKQITPDDLAAAEFYVRDWLGSIAAGGATPQGRILNAYGGHRNDPENKVFLAGALSHITETDDLHRASITHPACVVIPSVVLMGKEISAGGEQILKSIIAGYEAMIRVGESLGKQHYKVFHNTATAGVFGAAAAVAYLLDLDEEQWVWAFGNAGTQAAGLWQFNEDATMSKHLHAGHATEAGVRAALLAGEGYTGPEKIFEGDKGFFKGYCPDPVPENLLKKSSGWKIAETSIKPYPSCRHTHPAIDVALNIRQELNEKEINPEEIQSLKIYTYSDALHLTDNSAPATTYAAKFSIQFCVIRTLLNGIPSLESFEGENLNDAAVRALLPKTEAVLDKTLEHNYPEKWGAKIDIVLTGGDKLSAGVETAKGDPELQLNNDELDMKIKNLFRYGGFSGEDTERILNECKQLLTGGNTLTIPWVDNMPEAEMMFNKKS